jgi:transcription initiation factor TFIIIB Brf1 subunit/transcription initiation factor TFIIB
MMNDDDDDPFQIIKSLSTSNEKKCENLKKMCVHDNIVLVGIQSVCADCGQVISKNFSYEKEWRYYGSMDTKHVSDPNRCNLRKQDEKGIYSELEKYQINKKVIFTANDIYETVTKSKIFRGKTRKGIIFGCVFYAYNYHNLSNSCKTLLSIFDIQQKIALKGLKFVNLNLPHDSKLRIKNNSNNIENMITETLCEFNATPSQIEDVLQLYEHVRNKSSLLNRSRPQSVACGLIRYYILKTNPDYSLDYFRQKIKLSELTITRIVKEIETILNH